MSTRIAGRKVLAVVLAGGKGSRLAPLSTERAKPAVPFLGTYRLIDFTLSNLVDSGVQDVWVVSRTCRTASTTTSRAALGRATVRAGRAGDDRAGKWPPVLATFSVPPPA